MKEQLIYSGIIIIHAGIAWLLLKTWQMCGENYDRLPEKIPMHFGFSGKADAWAKKSKLSVYWPVGMIVFIETIFLATGVAFVSIGGVEMLLQAVLFSLLDFSICLMFHNVTKGVIDYSMNKAVSIWPYMKVPLVLTVLLSSGVAAMAIIAEKADPVVTQVTICKGVDKQLNAVDETKEFVASDKYVYALISWKNMNGTKEIEYRWLSPDGKPVHTPIEKYKYSKIKPTRNTWYRIDLEYFKNENVNIIGKWKLEIIYKGNKIGESEFTVK